MQTFLKDCRWGRFLLLRGDMISAYMDATGEWSELEVRLLKLFLDKDSIVVEVGANLGTHTVPLAKAVPGGKVIALEAQRVIFQLLCANAALNGLTNVTALHRAASNQTGMLMLPSCDYASPWNYGSFSLGGGFSTEGDFTGETAVEKVAVTRLDDLLPGLDLERLDLLKIDAEAHEREILEGAAATIAKYRPVIFVENNDEANGDALIARIAGMDYAPYWFCSARHQADNINAFPFELPGVDANMLCIPAERRQLPGIVGRLKPVRSVADLSSGALGLAKAADF
jgi:FkbM family methyltransferase